MVCSGKSHSKITAAPRFWQDSGVQLRLLQQSCKYLLTQITSLVTKKPLSISRIKTNPPPIMNKQNGHLLRVFRRLANPR